MLEAAVAAAECGHLEQVTLERCASAEQIDVALAHASEVACEPLEVAIVAAGDRDFMPHAACAEGSEREIAHLDRVIDELVVRRCAVAPESMRRCAIRIECRGHAPVCV